MAKIMFSMEKQSSDLAANVIDQAREIYDKMDTWMDASVVGDVEFISEADHENILFTCVYRARLPALEIGFEKLWLEKRKLWSYAVLPRALIKFGPIEKDISVFAREKSVLKHLSDVEAVPKLLARDTLTSG